MYIAFRRFLPDDKLTRSERFGGCFGEKFRATSVVFIVACEKSNSKRAHRCQLCNLDGAAPDSNGHHTQTFSVRPDKGLVSTLDWQPNAALGDEDTPKWVFAAVPARADQVVLVLRFLENEQARGAHYTQNVLTTGFVMRSLVWTCVPRCVSHRILSTCGREKVDLISNEMETRGTTPEMRQAGRGSSTSWFCSELALTCLQLLGFFRDQRASLSTPTSVYKLIERQSWELTQSPRQHFASRSRSSNQNQRAPRNSSAHSIPMVARTRFRTKRRPRRLDPSMQELLESGLLEQSEIYVDAE